MYGVPEITVQAVAKRRARGDDFVLLDVREPQELLLANLGDGILTAPLSELAARQLPALPPAVADDLAADVVIFCHHGIRSAQVVAWLRQQGWTNVVNMAGGINAYALEVDKTIGRY